MIWLYSFFILSISLLLAVIDLKTMELPNYLTLPLILIGLIVNATADFGFCSGLDALFGAVFGYFLIWGVNGLYYVFTKKDGIGMGDAKLLAAFGAVFGWQVILPILFIASVFGLIGGVLWLKLKKLDHQHAFPFGPYICLAGSLMLFDMVFKTFYIKFFLIQ